MLRELNARATTSSSLLSSLDSLSPLQIGECFHNFLDFLCRSFIYILPIVCSDFIFHTLEKLKVEKAHARTDIEKVRLSLILSHTAQERKIFHFLPESVLLIQKVNGSQLTDLFLFPFLFSHCIHYYCVWPQSIVWFIYFCSIDLSPQLFSYFIQSYYGWCTSMAYIGLCNN